MVLFSKMSVIVIKCLFQNLSIFPSKAERLFYDPNLNQEILISDTPLRKQIFVDPGTKVSRFRDPTGESVKTGGQGSK
jgi:hypothetical protein